MSGKIKLNRKTRGYGEKSKESRIMKKENIEKPKKSIKAQPKEELPLTMSTIRKNSEIIR